MPSAGGAKRAQAWIWRVLRRPRLMPGSCVCLPEGQLNSQIGLEESLYQRLRPDPPARESSHIRASSPIRSGSASNMPTLRPRARLPHIERLTVPPGAALVRAFAASLSGTALEWYDFAIYNVAAAV